jgi:iron complex transport system substrate-binding protein
MRLFWWQPIQLFVLSLLTIVLLQNWLGTGQLRSLATPPHSSSACRMVKHELGQSCIPLHPQRLITMDQESLEVAVALGFKPIAAASSNLVANKTAILQEKVGKIIELGKEGQPNLERIVQLKPDLILGMFVSPQIYPVLSQIAPTISIEYSQTGWKQTLQRVADLMDRQQVAEHLLKAYQQRIKTLQSQLAQRSKPLQVTVMRFYTDVNLTQFLNQNSFTVSILQELEGVSLPDVQLQQIQIPNSDYGYINISVERIDWLDSDIMFMVIDPGAEDSLQFYAESPLWQTLNVVQRQQVFPVNSGYWIFGNILSANAVLDDLSQYLIEKKTTD